jgi:hypothetical protein
MVSERWALDETFSDDDLYEAAPGRMKLRGPTGTGPYVDRVRVLDDGEVAVSVDWLKLVRLEAVQLGRCQTIIDEIDGVLPAPPEPPTAEEWEGAARRHAADGRCVKFPCAVCAMIDRADAAKGER